MKAAISVAFCHIVHLRFGISAVIPAQDDDFKEKQPKKEHFYALAYMPSGGGPRMVGCMARPPMSTSAKQLHGDAEAKHMAGALLGAAPMRC
jgi:hypothetical protein